MTRKIYKIVMRYGQRRVRQLLEIDEKLFKRFIANLNKPIRELFEDAIRFWLKHKEKEQ